MNEAKGKEEFKVSLLGLSWDNTSKLSKLFLIFTNPLETFLPKDAQQKVKERTNLPPARTLQLGLPDPRLGVLQ